MHRIDFTRYYRPHEAAEALVSFRAELLTGALTQEIGQLEGRANKRELWGASYPTSHLRMFEWTLRAPEGGELGIAASSQRAGVVSERLRLAI